MMGASIVVLVIVALQFVQVHRAGTADIGFRLHTIHSSSSAVVFMILATPRLVRSLAHTGMKGFAGGRFSG